MTAPDKLPLTNKIKQNNTHCKLILTPKNRARAFNMEKNQRINSTSIKMCLSRIPNDKNFDQTDLDFFPVQNNETETNASYCNLHIYGKPLVMF